jgi:hypothetical protein
MRAFECTCMHARFNTYSYDCIHSYTLTHTLQAFTHFTSWKIKLSNNQSYQSVNNQLIYTKFKGGEDIYRLPARNLTDIHLKHALEVVKEFDIILILENIGSHSPIVLSRGFGWSRNRMQSLNHQVTKTDSIETTYIFSLSFHHIIHILSVFFFSFLF